MADKSPCASTPNGNAVGKEGNRALSRGLAVLSYIRGSQEGARVAQIVEACTLDRATVYRIMGELIEHQYVEKSGRFHYVAGQAFSAPRDSSNQTLTENLSQFLLRISSETQETGFAIVPYGNQSKYVAFSSDNHKLRTLKFNKGHCHPLGVGAAGLAYLAALDIQNANDIIDSNSSSLKSYNQLSPGRLKNMMLNTRDRGWSISCHILDQENLGVGCAVYDEHKQPIAAISIAGPIYRMTPDRQKQIARHIHKSLGQFELYRSPAAY